MFERFDLPESHANGKTGILADGRLCLGSAADARFLEGAFDDRLQVLRGKTGGAAGHNGHRDLQNPDSTDLSDSMRDMTKESEPGDSAETEEQRLSKSARKREAASLQELGVQLSSLPDQEIKALGLPDTLFVALRDLRRLPSHGAQVRQRQYIGKLMRGIDPEPVLAKLAERKRRHDLEIQHFQQIERWRDRLLSEPAAGVEELQQEYPQIDREALLKLLGKAERERIEQRSPVGARELFAFLRQLLA